MTSYQLTPQPLDPLLDLSFLDQWGAASSTSIPRKTPHHPNGMGKGKSSFNYMQTEVAPPAPPKRKRTRARRPTPSALKKKTQATSSTSATAAVATATATTKTAVTPNPEEEMVVVELNSSQDLIDMMLQVYDHDVSLFLLTSYVTPNPALTAALRHAFYRSRFETNIRANLHFLSNGMASEKIRTTPNSIISLFSTALQLSLL